MEFTDKALKCVDCGEHFVFSAGEQAFFSEKQFQHEPKHCKRCKAKVYSRRARAESTVTCAACGTSTIVPFVPSQDRPVLCRLCLDRQRHDASPISVLRGISEQVKPIAGADVPLAVAVNSAKCQVIKISSKK
jgi:CxxC-x17-CxxC domain-containing protein